MTERDEEKRNCLVRPGQTRADLREDIDKKFSKPSKPVVDLMSETFETAKACLELPGHRRFVLCEIHEDFFAAKTGALAETYSRQAVNKT